MVRVIFAGITGLNKARMVEALAKKCIPLGVSKNSADSLDKSLIRIYDVDKEIVKHSKYPSITPFLDSFNVESQQNTWKKVFETIIADSEDTQDVFILMHLVYSRFGRFFSLFDLSLLEKFKPDFLVTLTDDVFHVWNEINKREKRRKPRSYFRLKEILSFRSVELVVADIVAQGLGINNQYIAIKHPPETFYKLIKTDLPIVYLCHPISATRENEQAIREINGFRKELEEKCVVLNPTTLDEKIIEVALKRQREECIIDKTLRWPIETDVAENYPIKLKLEEAREICHKHPIDGRTEIDQHIQSRDYRYIQQCNFMVAYRPFYGGRPHLGVTFELAYAPTLFKEILAYSPEEELTPHPFIGRKLTFTSKDQLLAEVEKRRRS